MIEYVVIPEQKKTIAILKNTEYDAVNKINKMLRDGSFGGQRLFVDTTPYLMKKAYRAVVVCSDEDEYSEEEGKRQAKEKLLRKYYKAYDKRIDDFAEIFCKTLNGIATDSIQRCEKRPE